MQFAFNENKLRIKPSYSGQRAYCPLCGGELIGKCGEIYEWHWQHHQDRMCDPWKEHETLWHKSWKAKFPEHWQEIVVEIFGQRHIADVRTDKNIVIEFQNSPINPSTIKIREDFYGDMIWVVNAELFWKNILLKSVVKWKVREIDESADPAMEAIEQMYNENLEGIRNNIEENKKAINTKSYEIKDLQRVLVKLNKYREDYDAFANDVLEILKKQGYFWDRDMSLIANKIEPSLKDNLIDIPQQINRRSTELEASESQFQEILGLEEIVIEGRNFKIVDYFKIQKTRFGICRAILKDSRNTFFPQVISFETTAEFVNFETKIKDYDFAVDPSDAIIYFTNKISDCRKSITDLKDALKTVSDQIRDFFLKELQRQIKKNENEIEQLNADCKMLQQTACHLDDKYLRVSNSKNDELAQMLKEFEQRKKEERFRIMTEKKGLYYFRWKKHERKSWGEANKTIYFDIGESYLFKKVGDEIVRKIDIDKFLKQYLFSKD